MHRDSLGWDACTEGWENRCEVGRVRSHPLDSLSKTYKRAVIKGFLEAAVWAESPEDEPTNAEDFSDFDIRWAARQCLRFLEAARAYLDEDDDPEQIGHDLWLTQAGHGAGFWDGDYQPEERGKRLTEITYSILRDHTILVECGIPSFY